MSYTLRVSRAQCEVILEALVKHPPQVPALLAETNADFELVALVDMFKATLELPEDPNITHAFVL